ncbi:hypothetical protein MNBD_UNCLBAC01-2153 [hydrothermal vent metagenome]|uniref:Uncharacterized protein n=1 Tax=hydrothermal vent metagenome TaxID=652676 RepID=A0A3B1D478_9ZZZZ
MKNFTQNKKSIILTLAFFVGFAAIFCCCLANETQAQTPDLVQQANSSCHSQDQQTTKTSDSDDCDCPHTLDIILEAKNSDIVKVNLDLTKFLKQTVFYFERSSLSNQPQKLFSKHFFPILSQNALPIYLQNASLRI